MNNTFSPFVFDGRLGRGRYLAYSLLMGVLATVLLIGGIFAVVFLGDVYIDDATAETVGIVFGLFSPVLGFSYTVRRLHDIGHSGKWAIPLFIPWGLFIPVWVVGVVAGIVLLYLLFAPGTDGPNGHGAGR